MLIKFYLLRSGWVWRPSHCVEGYPGQPQQAIGWHGRVVSWSSSPGPQGIKAAPLLMFVQHLLLHLDNLHSQRDLMRWHINSTLLSRIYYMSFYTLKAFRVSFNPACFFGNTTAWLRLRKIIMVRVKASLVTYVTHKTQVKNATLETLVSWVKV